jgi:hypothetical protein
MALMDAIKKKSQEAAFQAMLRNLKKGKSADQCKCIDYFLTPDDEEGAKKKKKGCFAKLSKKWDIDDYCKHVQYVIDSLGLKERAIAKIGLDESQISEIPPVALASFQFKGEGLFFKSEETEIQGEYKHVSNKYSVTWIFFSATQIYTYTYILDTLSDNSLEMTRDFFYTDITCIRTEHEVEEAIYSKTKGCGCLGKGKETYYHNNKHWDTLQITVPNDSYSFTCRTTDTIEQSIQAAKAMIREKKNG